MEKELKFVRLPVVNPEKDVKIRIKKGFFNVEEVNDGNQFYIIVNDHGISAATTEEAQNTMIDKLIEIFGVDDVLKLRIKFIQIPNKPDAIDEYLENKVAGTEKLEVLEDGHMAQSVEIDNVRYVDFPDSTKSFDMIKVSKNILNLEKTDG